MAALDKLSIDTPEHVALDFVLASVGSRFLALAVDTLIQTAATVLLAAVGLAMVAVVRINLETLSPWLLAVLFLVYFLIYNAYFAGFEALWNGQTPGKRVIGLRVISVTGRPISVFEAILRNVVRLADQLPGIYAIGIVSIFVTERNQRLGDLAAGTVVVHEREVEAHDAGLQLEAPLSPTHHGATRLQPEEVAVVELFMRRRDQLDDYSRSRKALQIADRIRERLGITERGPDEPFLEEVLTEYRDRGRYR